MKSTNWGPIFLIKSMVWEDVDELSSKKLQASSISFFRVDTLIEFSVNLPSAKYFLILKFSMLFYLLFIINIIKLSYFYKFSVLELVNIWGFPWLCFSHYYSFVIFNTKHFSICSICWCNIWIIFSFRYWRRCFIVLWC